MELKDLSVKHRYYCNDANYYSNDASAEYDTWEDFLTDYGECDMDYNLLFRWDIQLVEEENTEGNVVVKDQYQMKVYFMQQRRGAFIPILIREVLEENLPSIIEYLKKYWKYLTDIWEPINLI